MSLKKINQFAPFKDIEYHGIFEGRTPRWLEGIRYTIQGDRVFVKLGTEELEIVPESRISAILNKMYADPMTIGGRDKIYERIKEKYVGISRRNIMEYLKNQETWQLRKNVPKNHVTRPIISKGVGSHLEMDLIDMQKYAHYNSGNNWILVIVDIFSKKAWAFALKDKSATTVAHIIDLFLDSEKYVSKIQSDNGPEFKNLEMEKVFNEHNVKHIFSRSNTPTSNGAVERLNQTLKNMLFSNMTYHKTYRWLEILPSVLSNYNTSRHSSTGMTPDRLHSSQDDKLIKEVQKKLVKKAKASVQPAPQYQIGDYVRIAISRLPENRSNSMFKSIEKWTTDLYQIKRVIKEDDKPWSNPLYYVNGNYYTAYELQKIDINKLKLRPSVEVPLREKISEEQIPNKTPSSIPRRSTRLQNQEQNVQVIISPMSSESSNSDQDVQVIVTPYSSPGSTSS